MQTLNHQCLVLALADLGKMMIIVIVIGYNSSLNKLSTYILFLTEFLEFSLVYVLTNLPFRSKESNMNI